MYLLADTPPIWVFPLFILFAGLMLFLSAGGGMKGLERWASENNYRLVAVEYCRFLKGPFFFTAGKSSRVYYITIEHPSGRRSGYARVNPPMLSFFSDPVVVVWDKPKFQPPLHAFPVVFQNDPH